MPLYEYKPIKQRIQFKLELKKKMSLMMKLALMIKLRAVSGEMFVQVVLKRIDTARKIFQMQIEDGDEVFIPRELSQDDLPMAFRYYDPILFTLQDRCSEQAREKFQQRNQMHLERMISGSLKLTLLAKFEGEDKIEHKHKVMENHNYDIIDPLNSLHVKALQRSKYVSIEKDLNRLH